MIDYPNPPMDEQDVIQRQAKQIEELTASCAVLSEALKALHDDASEECLVYFKNDSPCDEGYGPINLGEAYQESEICEKVCAALKVTAGHDLLERMRRMEDALERLLLELSPRSFTTEAEYEAVHQFLRDTLNPSAKP